MVRTTTKTMAAQSSATSFLRKYLIAVRCDGGGKKESAADKCACNKKCSNFWLNILLPSTRALHRTVDVTTAAINIVATIVTFVIILARR